MATESKKSTKKSPSSAKKVDAEVVSSKTTATEQIDSKTLILLAHILGIVTSFVAPLVVFFVSNDALVKKHAAAALNFQISLIIYGTIITVVGGILTFITLGLFGLLLIPIYLVLFAYALIPPIIATIKANESIKEVYKYPLSLELIK